MQRQIVNVLGNVTRQVRSNQRAFSVTPKKREIFKVQSSEDFDKKVKNSQEPVIVDFFATLVKHILVKRVLYQHFPL